MGYSKETYEAVNRELALRRRRAEAAAEKCRQDFFSKNPEAYRLDRELKRTNSKIALATIQKNCSVRESLEKIAEENLKTQERLKSILAQNGLTPEDLKPKYMCPKCGDTGYIEGIRCECYYALLKKTVADRLNRVSPLSISSFETLDLSFYKDEQGKYIGRMERVYKTCYNFAHNFRSKYHNFSGGILMQGPTGLGKTHFSLAIAGVVIDQGYNVVYGSAYEFSGALERERFDRPEEDTETTLIDADLLILDDLGAEHSSNYSDSTIYNILDTRIMCSRPTVISTNFTNDQLKQRYGERFMSRIFSCFSRLPFDGTDIRIKKRKQGIY